MIPMQAKMQPTKQPTILIVGIERNPPTPKPFKRFLYTSFLSPMNKFMGYLVRLVSGSKTEFMGCYSFPVKFMGYCIGEQNDF